MSGPALPLASPVPPFLTLMPSTAPSTAPDVADRRRHADRRRTARVVPRPAEWVEQEAQKASLFWSPVGAEMYEASVWIAGRKRWWMAGDQSFWTQAMIDLVVRVTREQFGATEPAPVTYPTLPPTPPR